MERFLSVGWVSGQYPSRLHKALPHSPTVITVWDQNKLVGLARAIDDVELVAFCGDQEIKLTVKEYALFSLLVLNEGHVLTYEQIYRSVRGEEAFGGVNNAIMPPSHKE